MARVIAKCADVWKAIVEDKYIDPALYAELKDFGSDKMKEDRTSLSKDIQLKLNSWQQESAFEEACKVCNIKYTKLDDNAATFYEGTPGNISDFELTIAGITFRADLKLLSKAQTIETEVEKSDSYAHDADVLIYTRVSDHTPNEYWLNNKLKDHVIHSQEFELEWARLLDAFKNTLIASGVRYVFINGIDSQSGRVDSNLILLSRASRRV